MSEAHVYNFTKGVDNMFMFQPMYIDKCFDEKQLYLYQAYSPLLDSLLLCFLAEVISGRVAKTCGPCGPVGAIFNGRC